MTKRRTPEEEAAYRRDYRARQRDAQPAQDAPGSTTTPEPTPSTSPILRTRRAKWADLQEAAGLDPNAPMPAPKPRPAGAPARKPVRVTKTAGEAMSAIRRERAGNALADPLPGMCDCGTGRPHGHYFDGWIESMTDAQRKLVLERLAANHKADRFSH